MASLSSTNTLNPLSELSHFRNTVTLSNKSFKLHQHFVNLPFQHPETHELLLVFPLPLTLQLENMSGLGSCYVSLREQGVKRFMLKKIVWKAGEGSVLWKSPQSISNSKCKLSHGYENCTNTPELKRDITCL